jgi:hypothetical protein
MYSTDEPSRRKRHRIAFSGHLQTVCDSACRAKYLAGERCPEDARQGLLGDRLNMVNVARYPPGPRLDYSSQRRSTALSLFNLCSAP